MGLIDDVAADKTDAIEKYKAFLRTYDHISRSLSDHQTSEFLTKLQNDRDKYSENHLALVMSPEFQVTIERYIQI